jgi:hypothetical protein
MRRALKLSLSSSCCVFVMRGLLLKNYYLEKDWHNMGFRRLNSLSLGRGSWYRDVSIVLSDFLVK